MEIIDLNKASIDAMLDALANKPENQSRTDAMLDALASADPFAELRNYPRAESHERAEYFDLPSPTDLQAAVHHAQAMCRHAAQAAGAHWAVGPIGNIIADPTMFDLSGVVASSEAVEVTTYLAGTALWQPAFGIAINGAAPFALPVAQALELLGQMMRWAATLTIPAVTPAQIADLQVACHLLSKSKDETDTPEIIEGAVGARFFQHIADKHLAMIAAELNRPDPDHAPF